MKAYFAFRWTPERKRGFLGVLSALSEHAMAWERAVNEQDKNRKVAKAAKEGLFFSGG